MDINAIENMTEEELQELLAKINAMLNNETEQENREGEEPAEEPAELTEEQVEEIEQALEAIEERKKALKVEKRSAIRARAAVEGKTIKTFKEETNMNTEIEIRKSREYDIAYLNGIKTNDMTQARSLLSANGGGSVPVPVQLEDEIRNAWEEHQVMGLVKHSYFPGNVKIGFELSATGAVVHVEGAAAPDEEVLTIGTVTLTAESIKKWITVSDEAIEGTTVDTVGYLYKEIAQKIVEKAEEIMIGKITAAPTASTSTACAVAEIKEAPALDTVVKAVAALSGQAKDLHIVMNRQTYATFIGLGLNANYAVDVFDGLKDKIVFSDKLPAYSAASSDETYMIVGDFGYGAQANFPNGDDVTLKRDDLSLAEKDLVKIVGRQFVGMGVVAEKAFTRVAKN